MNTEKVPAGEAADQKVEKAERGRSRIEWPYFSLDEASKVAKGIFDLGGNCDIDQLAGHLDQSATGGGFRLKVQAARTFGLVNSAQGRLSLTDLGSELLEAEFEKEARAKAFLRVPLYNALYENFKGKTLPGPVGLEGAMANLGVAVKQKDKARQAFQRSAKEAGFFAYGATKLVFPVLANDRNGKDISTPAQESPAAVTKVPTASDFSIEPGLHPFIQGLLKTLPEPNTSWPLQGRRKWLQSALSIFDLIYEGAEEDECIEITVNKGSAN